MKIKILLFFSLLTLWACQKKEKLDFFQVALIGYDNPLEIGMLSLTGFIFGVDDFQDVAEVGFIWSTELDAIDNHPEDATWGRTLFSDSGNFSLEIADLATDSIYYIKAFAISKETEIGERTVFSEQTVTFSFDVNLSILPEVERINDQMVVSALITGLDQFNLGVVDHGFIYGKEPTLQIGVDSMTFLGFKNTLSPFTDTLQRLDFNTTYYVQAWAAQSGEEIFRSEIKSFHITDGWRRVADLPINGLAKAVSVADEQRGIVALGLNNFFSGVSALFEFTPHNDGLGNWETPYPNLDFATNRSDCVGFLLEDNFYIGLGENANEVLLNQIEKFDLSTNTWSVFPQQFPKTVSSSVSFQVNGKVYIGTGTMTMNDSELTNEFWEFNPVDETWRSVAALPFQASPLDDEENIGRYEAVSFVQNGIAYVGGGYVQGRGISNDFWRFIPPVDENELGAWELATFFPGTTRYLAVAMVQKNRVFYGMGDSFYNGELNDWWEYDPVENTWTERTPLPAFGRSDASVMEIGAPGTERGFLGAGTIRINENLSVVKRFLNDFWEYIPAQ